MQIMSDDNRSKQLAFGGAALAALSHKVGVLTNDQVAALAFAVGKEMVAQAADATKGCSEDDSDQILLFAMVALPACGHHIGKWKNDKVAATAFALGKAMLVQAKANGASALPSDEQVVAAANAARAPIAPLQAAPRPIIDP